MSFQIFKIRIPRISPARRGGVDTKSGGGIVTVCLYDEQALSVDDPFVPYFAVFLDR